MTPSTNNQSPPWLEWISVEVDTRCNVRCSMCPIGHDLVEGQGRVELATIEQIVRLAKGWTDKISLAVMGEPLLHPQCPDMVKIIKDSGFKALLWTNGLLLNDRRAREVLEAGLDKMVFSFELIDKDLHERIRVGASYDKVKANLDRFIALRDEINPVCEISVWNIVPDTDFQLAIPEHIRKNYPNVEHYVSHAMDWHGALDVKTAREKLGNPCACNQIMNYLSIAYTGEVIACCNDFNHEYVLGNVHNVDDLREIWFGDARLSLVAKQKAGNLSGTPPCATCQAPFERKGVDRVYMDDRGRSLDGKAASNAAKAVAGISIEPQSRT